MIFVYPVVIFYPWNITQSFSFPKLFLISLFCIIFSIYSIKKAKGVSVVTLFLILFFLLSLLLSVFVAPSKVYAILGQSARLTGLLFYLIFLSFVWLIVQQKFKERDLFKIFLSIILSSIIPLLYGLCEYSNFDFLNLEGYPGRLSTFFGQPNDYAVFLSIICLSTICFIYIYKRFIPLFYVIFELSFFELLLTYSRANIFGFFILFFSLLFFLKKEVLRFKGVSALLAIGVLVSIVLFFATPYTNPGWYGMGFSRQVGRVEDESLSQRITMWKASFDMFLKKPLTGYGLANYYPISSRFFDMSNSFFHWSARNMTFVDVPHNEFLEFLALGGLPLFVSFTLLVAFALYGNCISVFENKLNLISFFGFCATLIYIFFNFFVLSVSLFFFLFLALGLMHLSFKGKEIRLNIFPLVISVGCFCIFLYMGVYYNIDNGIYKINNNFQKVMVGTSALSFYPYDYYSYISLDDKYLLIAKSLPKSDKNLIEEMANSVERTSSLGLSLFPNDPVLYYYLGEANKLKGNYPEAKAYFLKSLEFHPFYEEPIIGLLDISCSYEDCRNSFKYANLLYKTSPDSLLTLVTLIRYNIKMHQYSDAKAFLGDIENLYPASPVIYVFKEFFMENTSSKPLS
ncbi:O-antigen polymerase [Thermodesulfobium narugense DSM 14796]|uniref:O-antigen polymerase n=2 Tax=Thermodesulfobium narugense TaxID=184064 RepID=M1E7E7_9BACT|nr:O-antigen polymerase [Thermodesulfobium narugense DSM 14796]